jgi:hypothetical protein
MAISSIRRDAFKYDCLCGAQIIRDMRRQISRQRGRIDLLSDRLCKAQTNIDMIVARNMHRHAASAMPRRCGRIDLLSDHLRKAQTNIDMIVAQNLTNYN